jgi:hypothetical protein
MLKSMRSLLAVPFICGTVLAFTAMPSLAVASAPPPVGSSTIYSSVPNPLPGNLPSEGAEAYAFNEFGDQIAFSGTARVLDNVVLTLSSWGCQSGHWYSGDCSTTPGATFSEPITFNIYGVNLDNSPGSLIASTTQTFVIPYRPSADGVHCTGGRWYDGTTCFNGLATNVTFDFSSLGVTLPDKVIYGIAYNTTHYGYSPIGESAACYASAGGCGYDSLNIAFLTDSAGTPLPPTVGTNVDPNTIYQNSPYGSQYCDGGLAGTGTFRLDSPTSGCWAGYTPAVLFNAHVPPPTSKDQCKHGGWATFDHPAFKNQGDCVSYVATHGKNG